MNDTRRPFVPDGEELRRIPSLFFAQETNPSLVILYHTKSHRRFLVLRSSQAKTGLVIETTEEQIRNFCADPHLQVRGDSAWLYRFAINSANLYLVPNPEVIPLEKENCGTRVMFGQLGDVHLRMLGVQLQ